MIYLPFIALKTPGVHAIIIQQHANAYREICRKRFAYDTLCHHQRIINGSMIIIYTPIRFCGSLSQIYQGTWLYNRLVSGANNSEDTPTHKTKETTKRDSNR